MNRFKRKSHECPVPPINEHTFLLIRSLCSSQKRMKMNYSCQKSGEEKILLLSTLQDSDLRSLDDERLNYLIALPHWIAASIRAWVSLVRTKAKRFNDFLWTSHLTSYTLAFFILFQHVNLIHSHSFHFDHFAPRNAKTFLLLLFIIFWERPTAWWRKWGDRNGIRRIFQNFN